MILGVTHNNKAFLPMISLKTMNVLSLCDINEKDNFPPHVDVTGTDNNSRFLVMFLYLSNNEKGQTVFLRQRPTKNYPTLSPCKRGNVLIFPPMWPWLHYGNFAVETPKYMVGSYLHYVD